MCLIVERTEDAEAGFVQHMRINHCRRNILVAKQFLNGSDIGSAFEKVGGEAVPVFSNTGKRLLSMETLRSSTWRRACHV